MFEPSGEIGKKDSRKLNWRPVEIQLKENHFVALFASCGGQRAVGSRCCRGGT